MCDLPIDGQYRGSPLGLFEALGSHLALQKASPYGFLQSAKLNFRATSCAPEAATENQTGGGL